MQIPEASKNIQAELASDSWIVKNWRALTALSFAFSILFFGLLEPTMVAWFGVKMVQPDVKVLEWHYTLVTICLTGYSASFTIEKIASLFIGRGR